MEGVAGQWQHAGNNAGKQDAAGPVARLARSCDRVRARSLSVALCVEGVLSMPPALMALYLSSCAESCAHLPK
jgi:hypothetical protein